MKIYGKYLSVSFFFGILFSIYGAFNMYYSGITPKLSGLVADMGFGDIGGCCLEGSMKYLIKLFPYYVYIMIFTTYIYRHFCEGSVYVFSRCENRVRWICVEMVKLFSFSGMYVVFMVFGRLLPGILLTGIEMDALGCRLLIYFIAIMTIWLFQVTLMGNIFAIVFNSQVGTMVTVVAQTLSVVALSLIDDVNLSQIEIAKLRMNLSSHLVVEWHVIENMESEYMGKLDVALSYNESFIYLILITFIWTCMAVIVIKKVDIIQSNKEI